MGIVVALTGSEASIPEWLEFAGIFLMLGSLVAGVVIAWRVHGRAWRRQSWIGLLVGMVIGGAAMNLLILGIAAFGRFIPNPFRRA